jgi:hypothetical protein
MTTLLHAAAVIQFIVAVLNLDLVQILRWREALNAMPLLMRQVFRVHQWFISITLAIFAVLTWRFAANLGTGSDAFARWFAGAIAIFWLIRAILQVAYYNPVHWRGKSGPTAVHAALLVVYSTLSVVYGMCALRGGS